MSDPHREHEAAEYAMHTIECRIASRTRWQRPHPDSVSGKVLASLEAKRDREMPRLIELREIAARTPRRPVLHHTSGDFPIATRKGPIDAKDFPDLPASLRRKAHEPA